MYPTAAHSAEPPHDDPRRIHFDGGHARRAGEAKVRARRYCNAGAGAAGSGIDRGAKGQRPAAMSRCTLRLRAISRPHPHLLEQTSIGGSTPKVSLSGRGAVPVEGVERPQAVFLETAVTCEHFACERPSGGLVGVPTPPLRSRPPCPSSRSAPARLGDTVADREERGEFKHYSSPTGASHYLHGFERHIGVIACAALSSREDHPLLAATEGRRSDEQCNSRKLTMSTTRRRCGSRCCSRWRHTPSAIWLGCFHLGADLSGLDWCQDLRCHAVA